MSRLAWPLRLPALMLVALTALIPAALTIVSADFSALPSGGEAAAALLVSVVFAVLSGALTLLAGAMVGLAAARLLPPAGRGPAPLATALAFLPWLLPAAVAALAWAFLATRPPGIGGPVAWYDNAALAWSLWLFVDVWRRAPLVALLVCVAARRSDRRLLECAALEGADARTLFAHVTLPALVPALVVSLLFILPAALGSFDLPYTLTRGGPAGTLTNAAVRAVSWLDAGRGAASAALISPLIGLSVAVGLTLLGVLATRGRRRV